MYLSLPEWAKIVLGTLVIGGFLLSRAAVRYPHVAWLRAFDFQAHIDPASRARLQRAGNIRAGAEMVLLGLALPLGYGALTLMMWGDLSPGIMAAVFAVSLVLILAGAGVIIRTLKDPA